MLLHHIRIQYAILLEIMGDGVLGQQRRLQADLGAYPFAFAMLSVEWVIATSATSELRAEIRTLDLVKLLHFAPGFIAHRSRYVDLEPHD